MSTTPTPLPTAQSWLKAHETLLITVFVLGVIVFLGHQWIDSHYSSAVKISTQAAQVLATQTQVNQSLQQKLDAQEKATQALTQQITQQNTVLTQQVATAQTKLAQQQAADTKLSNQQLVDRLNALTGQQIQANQNGGADLTQKQVTSVTQEVESVPVLKQQLTDETSIADNEQKVNLSLTSLTVNDTIDITNLNKEIADQKNSCNAEIKTLKAKGLRSKLKWFGAGVITGVVATVAAVIH